MENKFYIYIHLKKGTDEVFYVGKGTKLRYKKQNDRNPYWKNIVNKYGFDVSFLEENLSEKEAFELEIYWIAQFKAWNFKLANMTNGGEGMSGRKTRLGIKHTPESIEKMRQAKAGKIPSRNATEKAREKRLGSKLSVEHIEKVRIANTGKIRTEEAKEKNRIAQTGKKLSEETKEKMSQSRLGKKHSEESIKKMSDSKREGWRLKKINLKNK